MYKYLSLCTSNPSECWSFSLCRLFVSQFIWDSLQQPFVFGPLPSPLVYPAFWFLVFDSCLDFLITAPAYPFVPPDIWFLVLDFNSVLTILLPVVFATTDLCLPGCWLLPKINNVLCICPGLHLALLSEVTLGVDEIQTAPVPTVVGSSVGLVISGCIAHGMGGFSQLGVSFLFSYLH